MVLPMVSGIHWWSWKEFSVDKGELLYLVSLSCSTFIMGGAGLTHRYMQTSHHLCNCRVMKITVVTGAVPKQISRMVRIYFSTKIPPPQSKVNELSQTAATASSHRMATLEPGKQKIQVLPKSSFRPVFMSVGKQGHQQQCL